jgi:protein phosphatase
MFDVIGDIHGCFDEFQTLTKKLGYSWESGIPLHPNRKLVFVGDLTDRGPKSLAVANTVIQLVKQGRAHYTPGNHCDKLYRYFLGRKVQVKHGLETTVAEYEALGENEQSQINKNFRILFENAPLYLQLDEGKLVVAHAGIRKDYIGRTDKKVRTFVLYGDITGETLPDGRPVRRDWAKQYDGDAFVIYGHTPVSNVRFCNNTANIDTGCVFGGKLSALKYPEMEVESVPSTMPHVESKFQSFEECKK